MRHANRGFTLIELLTVIAIMALLSSIILTSVTNLRKKTIDTKHAVEIRGLKQGLDQYYAAHGVYPVNDSNASLNALTAPLASYTTIPADLFGEVQYFSYYQNYGLLVHLNVGVNYAPGWWGTPAQWCRTGRGYAGSCWWANSCSPEIAPPDCTF